MRLLIVDDEESISELLSRHFRFCGYEVDTAKDGQLALEKLEQAKFDIVVSDISMPTMGGIELLEVLRVNYPMIRVVMITAYISQNNVLSCMALGADACIFKPFQDLKEIDEAILNSSNIIKNWNRSLNQLSGAVQHF